MQLDDKSQTTSIFTNYSPNTFELLSHCDHSSPLASERSSASLYSFPLDISRSSSATSNCRLRRAYVLQSLLWVQDHITLSRQACLGWFQCASQIRSAWLCQFISRCPKRYRCRLIFLNVFGFVLYTVGSDFLVMINSSSSRYFTCTVSSAYIKTIELSLLLPVLLNPSYWQNKVA